MSTWKEALREGAVSGSIASVLSAAYLAWMEDETRPDDDSDDDDSDDDDSEDDSADPGD